MAFVLETQPISALAEHRRRLQALRSIALLEFAKGIAVLTAAISLYWVDPTDVVGGFLDFLHISPDRHIAQFLLRSADTLNNASMWTIILVACLYSGLRFAEAFGLWCARAWAEWIALISGAIYIPFEAYKLAHKVSIFHITVIIVNLAIVAYMFYLRIYLPRLQKVIARVH